MIPGKWARRVGVQETACSMLLPLVTRPLQATVSQGVGMCGTELMKPECETLKAVRIVTGRGAFGEVYGCPDPPSVTGWPQHFQGSSEKGTVVKGF